MNEIKRNDFIVESSSSGDDTSLIQEAIDKASLKRGRVVFKKDTVYHSGYLELKSNVTLYFEKGSVLKASDDLTSFQPGKKEIKEEKLAVPTYENCEYNGTPSLFFLYGKSIRNARIDGENGTIDGNEKIFYGKVSDHHIDGSFYPRVPLIYLEDTEGIEISNVVLTHSAFWTVHLVGCHKVHIHDLVIDNNRILANCDGIDPDHSSNVLIENCCISCADDCVVIKTTSANKKYGPSHDIAVKNCLLTSTSAGIKFGTETCSDIENVTFSNIVIKDSNRGIAFQLRDEGNISNVKFRNISVSTHHYSPLEWWGKGEPVVITAVQREKDTKLGTIRNLSFDNLNLKGENGIFIYGEENRISDISFKNIKLTVNSFTSYDKEVRDLRPAYLYPQPFKSPVSYVYLRNIRNAEFKNCLFTKGQGTEKEQIVPLQIVNSTYKYN